MCRKRRRNCRRATLDIAKDTLDFTSPKEQIKAEPYNQGGCIMEKEKIIRTIYLKFDETSSSHLFRHVKCSSDCRAAERLDYDPFAAVPVVAGDNNRYRICRAFGSCSMVLRGGILAYGRRRSAAAHGQTARCAGWQECCLSDHSGGMCQRVCPFIQHWMAEH